MRRLLLLAMMGSCVLTPVARAQNADRTTQRLIAILVKNGVLTASQAQDLVREAQQEAGTATPPAAASSSGPAGRLHAGRPAPAILTEGALSPAAPPPPASATGGAAPAVEMPPGTVRVTYVPDSIRRQIAAEVKQQVMQQSHDEGWTEPNVIPDWIQHIKISGDVRVRGQFDVFPSGNSMLFPDFNSINNSSNGYDANGTALPPLLNTTQDRTRVRLRARLDVAAQVADWISTDIRLATGNDTSPVSPNQTLGAPGDFSRYAFYLDRAYIDLHPLRQLEIIAGRGPNPFFVSDLMYDEDLNFDGFSGHITQPFGGRVTGFLTAGAFPIFNTAFNLSTNNGVADKSRDSYLLAGQAGADWRVDDTYDLKFAAGFFDYANIRGRQSSLCTAPTSFGSCDTDNTRQPFSQYGNTVFALRNINTSGGANTAQPQYYGLASAFGVLDLHGTLTYGGFAPVQVTAEGEFIKNLGFNRPQVTARTPVNNLGNNSAYVGGDTGYMARVIVGYPNVDQLWHWNASVAYKYLGSDATVDSFTDSKFHLGGTNAKGTVLTANLGLGHGVSASARWYSANQVSGPAYAVDSFLVDLNAGF